MPLAYWAAEHVLLLIVLRVIVCLLSRRSVVEAMYIKLNPYRSDDTVSIPAPPWLAPLLGTSGLTACCWCAACTLEILVACIPFCYLVFLVMLLWRYSKDGTEVETNGPLDVRVFNSAISFYSISLLMVKWDKASTPQYKRMPQICRHIITVNCVNMMRRGKAFSSSCWTNVMSFIHFSKENAHWEGYFNSFS